MAQVVAAGLDRFRCSYKKITIFLCAVNVLVVLYVLHNLLSPLYLRSSSMKNFQQVTRYSETELRRIQESIEARKAVEPQELIKRVKEIQQETEADLQKVKTAGNHRHKAAEELAKRLNELKEINSQMNQQALEEWRKKKMEDARKREAAKVVSHE